MNNLKSIQDFIEAMNVTSSTNDKKAVLQQFSSPYLKKILEYTYSPFKQYYVTPTNLKKHSELSTQGYIDIFSLLDDLNDRRITGNTAIAYVNGFIAENLKFSEVIYSILDRNLKTRATTTLINSVLPETIPTFDVALALPYDDKTKKKVKLEDHWYMSRKLDGVRCITIINDKGEVKFFSRGGNEFLTLDTLKADIKKLNLIDTVLDGEVCMMNESGQEDFQGIIKEIGRKNHTIKNPKYLVFDCLTLEEFNSQTSSTDRKFRDRITIAALLFGGIDLKNTTILKQTLIESEEQLQTEITNSTAQGWEGLMLRKDTPYIGKRSDEILKVKKFWDAEYIVEGVENSTHRVIEDGREVEEEMLGNIFITHKGNQVRVGSGFSIEQRRQFYKNPDQILGKTITVQYFEETTDQHGQHSLRFPVIKAIYEKTRTI
jgi:DNA ligase-1